MRLGLGLTRHRSGRANLFTASQDFSNGAWTKSGILAFGSGSVANATTAPDGTLTADLLTENSATSSHQVNQAVTTAAVQTTVGVDAKADTRSWLAIGLSDSGSVVRITYFDLGNGVVGTVGGGCTASIQPVANGFYHCAVTVNAALAGSNTIRFYVTTGNGVTSYTGDGLSGLYLWNAQI